MSILDRNSLQIQVSVTEGRDLCRSFTPDIITFHEVSVAHCPEDIMRIFTRLIQSIRNIKVQLSYRATFNIKNHKFCFTSNNLSTTRSIPFYEFALLVVLSLFTGGSLNAGRNFFACVGRTTREKRKDNKYRKIMKWDRPGSYRQGCL